MNKLFTNKPLLAIIIAALGARFLVDAKVYDIERIAKKENKSIPAVIKEYYGIEM